MRPNQRRRWLWAVLPLALCFLGVLGWQVYDWLTFRPTGVIAFDCLSNQRDTNGNFLPQICVINADGTNRRQITNNEFEAMSPTWSPDGDKIAFVAIMFVADTKLWHSVLYTINQDGSGLTQLVSKKNTISNPIWSPTGDQILVQANFDQQPGLYLIKSDPDNPAIRLLVERKYFPDQSAFSPDGSRIAYSVETPPDQTIIFNINDSSQNILSQTCPEISWSPSGEYFACSWLQGVELINIDTAETNALWNWATMLSQAHNPDWSPDGKYIVYSQVHWLTFLDDNNGELWIMRADGSQPTKLTDGPRDRNPAWRPEP